MEDASLIGYEAAVFANRRTFLLSHGWAFFAYQQLHETFANLAEPLSKGRNKEGKSYVSLIPLFLIMQRQAVNAFLSLANLQSFQAWVLLRPCLEACLIVGKWVDDPHNAVIWRNRTRDSKAYNKAYQGTALHSRSLPRSAKIQAVLKAINDDFLHANPKYYVRHTDMEHVNDDTFFMKLHYFDEPQDYLAHTFAFLHLIGVIQDSVSRMIAGQIVDQPPVIVGLDRLEEALYPELDRFLSMYPARLDVVEELGLWQLDTNPGGVGCLGIPNVP